ncbi:MAG: hypothetical protein RJA49_1894, partial [Actinomycetota bacterium]
KRLFAGGTVPTVLRLTDSMIYPSGTLHLTYAPAGDPTYATMG